MRGLINKTKAFGQILSESTNKTLTLYHGTCEENGIALIKSGWQPSTKNYGGNMGNPSYLYLSSEPEDALWFAEEKGCNTIIEVINIPIDYLMSDPEDEAGFTMKDLLDRVDISGFPAKFALTKPLNSSHFKKWVKKK